MYSILHLIIHLLIDYMINLWPDSVDRYQKYMYQMHIGFVLTVPYKLYLSYRT